MVKKIIFSFFLIINTAAHAQFFTTVRWQKQINLPSSDSIYYQPGEKLSWSDFKGIPNKKSIAIAITSSGFGYALELQTRNSKSTLVITVYCFFNKRNSWVKQGNKSDYALLHEQHHFDVTYIAANLFVKKLREANFTLSNYEQLLEKINKESDELLEKMQNDYDDQTINGQLTTLQAYWNRKIDEQLAALIKD